MRARRTPAAGSAQTAKRSGGGGPAPSLATSVGNRTFARMVAPAPRRDGPVLARNPAAAAIGTGIGAWIVALSLKPRFEEDLGRIVYDDETRRHNESQGKDIHDFWEGLWDAWGYCFIAAAHASANPTATTWALGHAYDAFSTAVQNDRAFQHITGASGDPEDTTAQDVFNRSVGMAIGERGRWRLRTADDLYRECWNAMVGGRLDLTAAGVLPRGRRLRLRGRRPQAGQNPRQQIGPAAAAPAKGPPKKTKGSSKRAKGAGKPIKGPPKPIKGPPKPAG